MTEYILIFLEILVIPLCASYYIKSTYKKYKRKLTTKGVDGFDVARKILDNNGLKEINIVEVNGTMTDHYDPSRKVVRLSTDVFHGKTVAAAAIAAHECGHALQDKENYFFMKFRHHLVPFVNLTSKIGYILLIISFVLSLYDLSYFAILLMCFNILFQLVTLPVEINASKRANIQLEKLNLLNNQQNEGAKQMLIAAALTYVASLISSLLEILRLLLIVRSND